MAKKRNRHPGRDVGKMGEGVFHTWCGEGDLIHNQAGDDKGGWDYLVQFKPGEVVGHEVRSLDRLPTSPACWVQVKSTDSGSNPEIKLSNWKRMVDYPTPVFILLLNFAGRPLPKEAWFVHVDQDLVAKVLQRLREAPLDKAGQLHKLKMTVTPRAADLMTTPSGIEMRKRMEAVLGPDPARYFDQKRAWKDRAGETRLRVQLSFSPEGDSVETLHNRLVEFALGLSEEISTTLLGVEEVRFDIPVRVNPENVPQRVTLRVPDRPHAEGKVEFMTESGLERSSLPCRVYHPWNLFPFILKERLRYRVATKDFDLVFKDGGGADLHGSPGLDEERTLADWASSMRVLSMLQGDASLTYEIDVRGVRVPGHIGADGRTVTLSQETRSLMEAAINASTVLAHLGLDPGQYRSSGRYLVAGAPHLDEAARVLSSDRMSILVSGEVEGEVPEGALAGLPLVVAAPIGMKLIVAGIAVHGLVRIEQDPSESGEAGSGKKPFLVRNPQVDRVFVKVVSMPKTGSVALAPFVEEVISWIKARGLDVIPSRQMLPAGKPAAG